MTSAIPAGFVFMTIYLSAGAVSIGDVLGITVSDKSYFYRFKSSYLYGEERVDFNVVAACAVRVTGYGNGSSSYDAFRHPTNYVRRTKDGGALWQYITDACRGETNANGDVPHDFFPGIVLLRDASDLSLGTGYFSEDAFEYAGSKLKFLGSSIERATKSEFENYRKEPDENLIDPRVFTAGTPGPTPEEVKEYMWDKSHWKSWFFGTFSCFGVQRFPITDPAVKSLLSKYQPPASKYWTPNEGDLYGPLRGGNYEFLKLNDRNRQASENSVDISGVYGFPTRAGGGVLHYPGKSGDIFPVRYSDAVPWLSPELKNSASPVFRDVDVADGTRGTAYCYIPMWPNSRFVRAELPAYANHPFIARVGQDVVMQGAMPASSLHLPQVFFENTDYVYYDFNVFFH